jgi:hypothetical protein
LGPALVAALIYSVGRTAAFNLSTAGWIPCGLLLAASSLTLARDEAAMQRRLKHSISRMSPAPSARASAVELASGAAMRDPGGSTTLLAAHKAFPQGVGAADF